MKKYCSLLASLLLFSAPSFLEADCCCHHRPGEWLPQTELWMPLIANPREPTYSVAYRIGDKVVSQSVAAVSFADDLLIYRWYDRIQCGSAMQISIQGGIWGLFMLDSPSHDLVNADYYVGIPLTYVWKKWSARLRLYHISSHLGDEFLLDHSGIIRYNPAIEAIDLYLSYQWLPSLRLYAGIGDYFISDRTFPQRPLYLCYGFEYKPVWWVDRCRDLIWKPFLAVFLQNREMDKWSTNQSYSIGMEVGRFRSCGRKVRLSIDWYDGFYPDGQLQRFHTSYGQLRLVYDY